MTESGTARVMRRGLLALSALGVAGTAIELAMLRHWDSMTQLIPWVALLLGGACIVLVVARPSPLAVRLVAVAGAALAVAGITGVIVHVIANVQAAPLDGTVGPTWDALSMWRQLWMASTGEVGPAPSLAAAALVPTGLALALSTYGHPALREPDAEVAPPGVMSERSVGSA